MGSWHLALYLSLLLLILLAPSLEGGRSSCKLNGSCSLNEAGHQVQDDSSSTTWAVLVAGSNGYYNYRHQADVCHAYQILKRGGLKDENIVVFMYDDIAHHESNPKPGVIINNPKGHDVYVGVPKDYTGDSVTTTNLYAVILGDKKSVKGGSGKVVDSKPNDRIFIYYSDHGGPGTLGMPNSPHVYAKDFIQVLEKKYAAGTYKEMVIYVESCESGSIFEGLLKENMNIYVTTASKADENSWGTYCPDMEPPPPPEYDTCLGDLYSVAWMEDSDKQDANGETLEQQYKTVKLRTYNHNSSEGSHVMEYGTKDISLESISLYQGFGASSNVSDNMFTIDNAPMGVVNQRDADLVFFQRKYKKMTDGSQEKKEMLKQMSDITNHRSHLDRSIDAIGTHLFGSANAHSVLTSLRPQGKPLVDNWECLKSLVRVFETHCGVLTQYGMKHMRAFANICNNKLSEAETAMEDASIAACSGYDRVGQWSPLKKGYSA